MTIRVETRRFFTKEEAEKYIKGFAEGFIKGYSIEEIEEKKFKFLLAFAM